MKTKQPLFALTLLIFISTSCKKPGETNATLSLIQHKWTIDSILEFSNPNFAGSFQKIGLIQGYSDLRTDGKQYSYTVVSFAGGPISTYDTSVYELSADNKSLRLHLIENGIVHTDYDSVLITTLTDNKLVVSNTSEDFYGFGRFYMHR